MDTLTPVPPSVERLKYSIDAVTRDEIAGWALREDDGPVPVRLEINGRPMDVPVQRIAREDIANAYPAVPDAAQSGFRILLPSDRIEPAAYKAIVRVRLGEASVVFDLPSVAEAEASAIDFWRGRQSPFPPEVMALIEATSRRAWRSADGWGKDAAAEAAEVLLFLLKTGSRRAKGLFGYFTYLSRVAHAFRFTEKEFPRTTSSAGKDHAAVASSAEEHFLIAHHLMTLKAHELTGDFLEFGCFKGFSTSCLSFACQLLGTQMHVFDSFAGLPASGSSYYCSGDFAGSLGEVTRNVRNFGSPQNVNYHQGFFADTLPQFKTGMVSCIWLDVDLESSARDVMQILPRLDPRGCIFSHECWSDHFDEANSITAPRSHESVLPPVRDAFTADNRQPLGRYLVGRTGVIWDRARSVPPPTPDLLRLYQALLQQV